MSSRPVVKLRIWAAVSCLCLLVPSFANAAPIVLYSTRNVSSVADIDFTGTTVSAINLNGSNVTVGGVNFTGLSLPGLNNGGFGDANLGSPEMNHLFNTSQWGAAGSYSIAATPGQMYRAQFFGYNRNTNPRPFDVTVEGSTFSNWNVFTSVTSVAKLLEAEWTQEAGDTTINFSFAQNASQIQLSGFLVQSVSEAAPVPEPTTMLLSLTGLAIGAARRRARRR